MIILQVGNNGLGNQLYTYAMGFVLEKIYGKENVKYDVSQLTRYVRGRKMYDIRQISTINYQEASIKEIRLATGMDSYRLPLFFSKRLKNDEAMISYVQRKWEKRKDNGLNLVVNEKDWEIEEKNLQTIRSIIENNLVVSFIYLLGYWQNIHYFIGYEELLKKQIYFKSESERYYKYLAMIKETKSVSVHVRRGDFLQKDYVHCFYTCHRDYYLKAFELVDSFTESPHYFFFGDDIPNIKKSFSYLERITFVEGLKDYEDLLLMTRCNINIISNSTFAFWGGFLNAHEDAVVISPRIQYLKKDNGKWKSVLMSVPDNWIII